MHASPRAQLIYLLSVAKSFSAKGRVPKVVFRPTTVTLPVDRRGAVLGGKGEGKTVFLQILAGAETPDQGHIIVPARLSSIINSGGLLHPQLTGFENIRFVARMFGVDARQLTAAVDAFGGIGDALSLRMKSQDVNRRKALEAALTIALPFDCYLLDNIGQMAPEMLEPTFEAAARRNAGVIFATSKPRMVRQFANFAIVINDQTLHAFSHVEEAIRFHERYATE